VVLSVSFKIFCACMLLMKTRHTIKLITLFTL
jgi:hypothetical protein